MALVKVKPTSPGRRAVVKVVNPDLHKGAPYAGLLESQSKNAGRNNNGHVTTRHQGGGHKQHYRLVDFKRNKDGIPAKVERIEYDPNRTANIALLIPLGYLLGSLLPRPQLWIAYVALPVASTIIELIQWFAMPGRVGSVNDIVANSLGAWIGLTITVVIHGKNAERETSVGQKPLGGIS